MTNREGNKDMVERLIGMIRLFIKPPKVDWEIEYVRLHKEYMIVLRNSILTAMEKEKLKEELKKNLEWKAEDERESWKQKV